MEKVDAEEAFAINVAVEPIEPKLKPAPVIDDELARGFCPELLEWLAEDTAKSVVSESRCHNGRLIPGLVLTTMTGDFLALFRKASEPF